MATRETVLRGHRPGAPLSDVVVRWTAPFLVLVALALLPWTFWLSYTLPGQHVSEHYDLAWTGFDLFLAAAIGGTAFGIVRRGTWVRTAAAISAALLICDAWFDVLTAGSGSALTQALVLALACELPLAALCLFVSLRCDRFYAHADSLRHGAGHASSS